MKKIIVLSIVSTLLLTSCSWGTTEEKVTDEIIQTNANYMVYEDQDFASTNDAQVLFFHAEWCPDCVLAHKNIAESSTTGDVKIYKIDYDNSDELRKKYEITKQHTFVQIDNEGNMLKKWTGTTSMDDILAEVIMPEENKNEATDEEMTQEVETQLENIEEDILQESQSDENNQNDEPQNEDTISNEEGIQDNTLEETEIQARNSYIVYQDGLLDDGEPKILFFHATWCPSCKAADESLSQNDNTIGIDVVKVDYDQYSDLKETYGVVSQHTFVFVDGEGNMMKRWYGSRSYGDILEELQS